jgi:phenylacetic acid degradation operon negative regulatory protein
MLFDIYGDFSEQDGRTGSVRLGALVQFAAELGVGEAAVRSAAARLVQDGWLAAERHGRESVYALTSRGRRLVAEGRRRIFEPTTEAWDGRWCLVALSVPEARRELRDRMRKALTWLGFGSPSSALYLSPRDQLFEVIEQAEALEASLYLQVYRAQPSWPHEPGELVARAWPDLAGLDRRYADFVRRQRPLLARDRARLATGELPDREAFQTRFSLASTFRRLLFGDPELPTELLPPGWHGATARRLFLAYHEQVTPPAMRFYDAVCAAECSILHHGMSISMNTRPVGSKNV